jgi:hypothetical protein
MRIVKENKWSAVTRQFVTPGLRNWANRSENLIRECKALVLTF